MRDIRQVIAKKVQEMERVTPGRAAFIKALEPKQERPKAKKVVNVSAYQRATEGRA